jgi:hypothetical protein
LANVEGNNRSSTPFSGGSFHYRYQQVFAASQFSGIVQGGGWINGMILRSDGGESLGGPGYSIQSLQINFSTTSKLPDSLSSTFADNVGPDDTIVFGPANRGAGALYETGSSPQPFYELQAIRFSTPFFYDPLQGNLLLDIRKDAESTGSGSFDGELVLGDSISRVLGFTDSSTAFLTDSFGLVVDFQVTPVPEPSAAIFLVVCALSLGVSALKGRRKGSA